MSHIQGVEENLVLVELDEQELDGVAAAGEFGVGRRNPRA
jgi:hypothetical protein